MKTKPQAPRPSTAPASDLVRRYSIALLLAAAILAIYGQVVSFDFVNFDDHPYVTENVHVRAGLTWAGTRWAFTATAQSNWHPLTWLSLMLDAQMGGLNPHLFHLTNLLLHLANTLVLFHLLRRLTGFHWRSAAVAALFAVHPLHVESVAWVAERKDVLSTLFWLLTMWAYLRYTERQSLRAYLGVVVLFGLGLMAKPMLVTLPLILLLIDFWPLGRLTLSPGMGGVLRNLLWEKVPLFALAGVSSIITVIAQEKGGAIVSLENHALPARVANALVSYVRYIGKMLWPQGLAVLYPHPRNTVPLALALVSAVVLLILSWLALRAAPRRPYLAFGWLWYVITLVPVIGLVQVGNQAMADRYTYVPLIGLFVAIVWWITDVSSSWTGDVTAAQASPGQRRARLAFGIVFSALVALLMGVAYVQAGYWKNSVTLYQRALAVTKDNAVVENNIGEVLSEQGRTDEAIVHFRAAMRINPGYATHQVNLAATLIKGGQYEEGIALCRDLIARWPALPRPHHDLGLGLLRLVKAETARGSHPSPPGGSPTSGGIALDPVMTAKLRTMRAEGITQLREALRLDPESGDAHLNLGVAMAEDRKFDEAAAQFSEVLRLRPGDPVATKYLGIARARKLAGQ